MASTEQIIKAATELGELIADHPAAKKFADAVQRIREDTDAQRVLNDFNRQVRTIQEKEVKGDPIEVSDKRRLEELQDAVIQSRVLRDFQMVQMDYIDLMRRVDEAMHGPNAPDAEPISGPDVSG
ncbi:MAG: hypothetical protein CMJ18_03990 [Phycisphaeraceae bacterium]|nr:hypothetical protein [Phycisphaeraceae bacterium]